MLVASVKKELPKLLDIVETLENFTTDVPNVNVHCHMLIEPRLYSKPHCLILQTDIGKIKANKQTNKQTTNITFSQNNCFPVN